MKRIVIFGDSYCATDSRLRETWPRMIANTYRYEVVNFAVHGSSTEYSLRNFIDFIKNGSLRPDDIIIFQTSTLGRLDFSYQDSHPKTATQYEPWNATHLKGDEHSWYYENKDYIKWFVVNRNDRSLHLQQTAYLHLVKSFAEANPSNIVILLKNTDVHDYTIPFTNFPCNMFVPDVDLDKISTNETGCHILEFTKYTTYDVRENHLTLPNRQKLADLIIQVIENNTIENFTYDSFAKNIIKPIKNRDDYDHYVALGLLEENDMVDFRFNK